MSVFKYCGAHGMATLQNLELKVTPPNQFNDPFELCPVIECQDPLAMAKERAKEVAKDRDFYERNKLLFPNAKTFDQFQRFVRANITEFAATLSQAIPGFDLNFQKELVGVISQFFGVVCFSSDPEEPLMWSHYCDSHKGLVIEFEENHKFLPPKALFKVEYSGQRVAIPSGAPPNRDTLALLIKRKSSHWSYEQELRLIVELRFLRLAHAGQERLYFLKLKPEWIKSVTLGMRSSKVTKDQVAAWVSQPQFKHVSVYQAVPDPKAFKINREKIT